MGLKASNSGGGDFELAPQGAHIAVCSRLIDLGNQYSDYYQKWAHKAIVSFVLCNELMEDGKTNFMVQSRYTVSLHDNAVLRKHLESWRGRAFTAKELEGFDLQNVLGKPCQVNIVHNESGGKTYANITAIMPLPKGVEAPKLDTPTVKFDLDEPDWDVYDSLSQSLRETIAKSPEYKLAMGEPSDGYPDSTEAKIDESEPFDDSIPF